MQAINCEDEIGLLASTTSRHVSFRWTLSQVEVSCADMFFLKYGFKEYFVYRSKCKMFRGDIFCVETFFLRYVRLELVF